MSLMIDGWMPSVGSSRIRSFGRVTSAQHIGESGKQAEYLVVNDAFNARAGGEAGHQIFAHREQRKNLTPLRNVAETGLSAQMARQSGHLLAVPSNRPGSDTVQTDNGAQ